MNVIRVNEFEVSSSFEPTTKDLTYLTKLSNNITIIPKNNTKIAIKPKGIVGIIQLSSTQLIITPKVKLLNFFYLLSRTNKIRNSFIRSFPISWFSESTQTVKSIVSIYLDLLDELFKKGIRYGYYNKTIETRNPKGQISVLQTIRAMKSSHIKFICETDDFSIDIPENQVILFILNLFTKLKITHDKFLTRKIRYYIERLKTVSLPSWISSDFISRIPIRRNNKHYAPILEFSKLIIENIWLGEETGKTRFYSLLIKLNNLFEEFVRTFFEKVFHEYVVTKEFFKIKISWNKKNNEYIHLSNDFSYLKLEPDVTVRNRASASPVIVADAKYKIIRNYNVSDIENKDVYQILSYCKVSNAKIGVLVYPSISENIWAKLELDNEITIYIISIPVGGSEWDLLDEEITNILLKLKYILYK